MSHDEYVEMIKEKNECLEERVKEQQEKIINLDEDKKCLMNTIIRLEKAIQEIQDGN